MQKFIGVKVVSAVAMSRQQYNDYRGWQLPSDENGTDDGYLVEYANGSINHEKHIGYISWSPKQVFEHAYRPVSGMSFGHAIEALKQGQKVSRVGWNGKGMWLVYVPGTKECALIAGTPYHKALAPIDTCEILPHIDMWTVNAEGRRAMLPGWLASQSDMLAEDWCIVN